LNTQHRAAAAPASTALPFPASTQAWYLVFVLLLFYIFSFIDRQIIALLVEPMKRDLHVSDTMIGLMQGLAFAALYCTLGIPLGRLADSRNRKSIIAGGILVWSFMATLCGLAKNAWQLLFARVGVGVGEAALSPAAYSMITDAFPREKLGRAFSIYNMGIAIGSGVALLVGGLVVGAVSGEGKTFTLPLIGEIRAWQFVFIVTGAPGLVLPLLLLTVREPVRRGFLKTAASGAVVTTVLPLREVIVYMVANRHFYRLHFLAMAMMSMLGYGVGAWLPTVMARTYHPYGLAPAEMGRYAAEVAQVLGISVILVNTFGIFLAGRISDLLTKKGHADAPILVCFGTAVLVTMTSTIPAFMPTAKLGLIMMCIAGLPFHGYVAMGPMAVNQVTPNQLRAQVSSVYLFTINLLGVGVGPFLVPFISDHVLHDPMKIRWALAIVIAFAGTIAAILLWRARGVYREKVAATAEWL
jgi:MFS family permease